MIPSIAGYNNAGKGRDFERYFASTCTRDSSGKILSGEIGVGYYLKKNLRTLSVNPFEDDDGLARLITQEVKDYSKNPDERIPLPSARSLVAFYRFATDSSNDLFFIRKGFEVLGLFRRTSGYIYNENVTDKEHHYHRVTFQRVRDATPEEAGYLTTVKFPTGKGLVPGMIETPLSPSVDPRDAQIAELKAKLEAALADNQRLSGLLERIRSITLTA